MSSRIRTIEPRHLTVRCVACGLSIRASQGLESDECPRCNTRFEERPPRSYADMEGLMEVEELPVVLKRPAWRERQLVERWLAVGFGAVVVVVVILGWALTTLR